MKVLPFTIPIPDDHSIIIQEEKLPHFYPYLHRHAEVQITWIKKGEGTLLAGNSMHVFKSDEIYLLGANLPHLFKSDPVYFSPDSNLEVTATTIFFNPSANLSALFKLPEMKALLQFVNQWQSGLKVPDVSNMAITEHITSLQASNGVDQLYKFIGLLNVLSGINDLEPLSSGNYSYPLTEPEGLRIASVYNFIMQNYSRNLTLEDVATHANLSSNAFCRYFKKHTRHTFVHFVNKVRINEACKLLTNSKQKNIATIACDCGFNSITNFNYVFKSITGTSPRAYINMFAKTIQ